MLIADTEAVAELAVDATVVIVVPIAVSMGPSAASAAMPLVIFCTSSGDKV